MFNVKKYSYPFFAFLILIFLATSIGFSQTNKETQQWKKCMEQAGKQKEDTAKIAIYEQFIAKYPEHYFLQEAKNRVASIVFRGVLEKNEIVSFRDFLEKYPDSPEAGEAKKRVAEYDDLEKAKRENTVEAFQRYLQLYPQGRFDLAAKAEIIRLRLADKSNEDVVALFQSNGIQGQYTPHIGPNPYLSMGFYSGNQFFLVLVKYRESSVLKISDIVKIAAENTRLSMEGLTMVPRDFPNGGSMSIVYKEIRDFTFSRHDPFFVFIISNDLSLKSKVQNAFDSLGQ